MKTIKDLKNYVKKTSRYCIKDYLDPKCFYVSEYKILMEERVRRGIDTNTGDVRYG